MTIGRTVWLLLAWLSAINSALIAPTDQSSTPPLGMDIYVVGGKALIPNSRSSLRVILKGVTGLTSARAVPAAEVELSLWGADRPSVLLFRGQSNQYGIVEAGFVAPDWPDGSYTMKVQVQSPIGSNTIEQAVSLKRASMILLSTDRPIYPPGQPIYMRALALREPELRPLAQEELQFEIRDSRGATVCDQIQKTNDFGVTSLIFSLADDANLGDYQIVVTAKTSQTEPATKTISVMTGDPPIAREELFNISTQYAVPIEATVSSSTDTRGNACTLARSLVPDPNNDQVLLRTNKAIYRASDIVSGTVRSTFGSGVVYLDLIRSHRTLLTHTLALQTGQGSFAIPLSADIVGAIELHAYQILDNGEVVRDGRVLYVQPKNPLTITMSQDKPIYRPGDEAHLKFTTIKAGATPTVAALSVIMLNEDMYGLKDLPPGVDNPDIVFVNEFIDPLNPMLFGLPISAGRLILADGFDDTKQEGAKALLAQVKAQSQPELWSNPPAERLQQAKNAHVAIAAALGNYAKTHSAGEQSDGTWRFRPGLLDALAANGYLAQEHTRDPFGKPYQLDALGELWPELAPEIFLPSIELRWLWKLRCDLFYDLNQRTKNFSQLYQLEDILRETFQRVAKKNRLHISPSGREITWEIARLLPGFRINDLIGSIHARRLAAIYAALSTYGRQSEEWYRISVYDQAQDRYRFPVDILQRLIARGLINEADIKDIWGRPFIIRERVDAAAPSYNDSRLRFIEIVSLGRDGVAQTGDDRVYTYPEYNCGYHDLAAFLGLPQQIANSIEPGIEPPGASGATKQEGSPAGCAPIKPNTKTASDVPACTDNRQARARAYYLKPLLFIPTLVTNAQGEARLKVTMPDTASAWHLIVSAIATDGGFGSLNHRVRVLPVTINP